MKHEVTVNFEVIRNDQPVQLRVVGIYQSASGKKMPEAKAIKYWEKLLGKNNPEGYPCDDRGRIVGPDELDRAFVKEIFCGDQPWTDKLSKKEHEEAMLLVYKAVRGGN